MNLSWQGLATAAIVAARLSSVQSFQPIVPVGGHRGSFFDRVMRNNNNFVYYDHLRNMLEEPQESPSYDPGQPYQPYPPEQLQRQQDPDFDPEKDTYQPYPVEQLKREPEPGFDPKKDTYDPYPTEQLKREEDPKYDPKAAAYEPYPPNQEPHEFKPQGLVLSDEELQKQMAKLRSKFPTSEADYLAAARARSAAKVQSQNSQANDEDWARVKKEAQERGTVKDDWENSKNESGNVDSQILIPVEYGEGGQEDGGEGEEPKLMLF